MNNKQIIDLIGYSVNSNVLKYLKSNQSVVVLSWADAIQLSIDNGESHFSVAAQYSNTGNPQLIKL